MMYSLEKNSKGMITTQVRNGEAGNIYANRKEINKQALKNLKKNTPAGKLGKLGDLQIFNFNFELNATGTYDSLFAQFNDDPTVSINDCVMFSNGKSGDGIYYNILDVKVNLIRTVSVNLGVDSFVEFYLLQNGTTPTGEKIPRTQGLFDSVNLLNSITTGTTKQSNQYFTTAIGQDTQSITTNSLGLRASGLALKTVNLELLSSAVLTGVSFDVMVFVDNSSVSRSF